MCRSSQLESKLRNCWALGEAAASFATARPAVLQFAQAPPAVPSSSTNETETSWKRRLQQADEPNKRVRTSARLSGLRIAQEATTVAQQEAPGLIQDSEADDEYEPGKHILCCSNYLAFS